MIQPRKPQTALREPESEKSRDGVLASLGFRARQDRDPLAAPAELAGVSELRLPVRSREEARPGLFGDRGRAALVGRCRDDGSLISATRDHHAYLAAYVAHARRSHLASAPIRTDDDHGLQEVDDHRAEFEAMDAPWAERRQRVLELDARGPRHLVKTRLREGPPGPAVVLLIQAARPAPLRRACSPSSAAMAARAPRVMRLTPAWLARLSPWAGRRARECGSSQPEAAR